jgi:hypothetical protein
VEEAEAFVGKADDELRSAEVVDFRDRGDAVEEDFGCGRSFGGLALHAHGEAFAEQIVEADEALIETLKGGLKACEAKVGVEHGESAGKLIGVGQDAGSTVAVGEPDLDAGSKAGGRRVGVVFGRGSGGSVRIGFLGRIGEIHGEDGGNADAGPEVDIVVAGNFGDMIAAEDGCAGLLQKRAQAGGGSGL